MKLEVKNISNADEKYLEQFYFELSNLHPKIIDLINQKKLKIILANKFSEIADNQTLEDLKKYKEDYDIDNLDTIVRGNLSDHIEGGSIDILYNTTKNVIGLILYHEIGHLVDYSVDFNKPIYSSDKRFINAYKKDLKLHWNKIKKDKRYRLIHYIQNSTPNKPSDVAMAETFAFCFAGIFSKFDDIDIINEYFENCLKVTKDIVNEFLNN